MDDKRVGKLETVRNLMRRYLRNQPKSPQPSVRTDGALRLAAWCWDKSRTDAPIKPGDRSEFLSDCHMFLRDLSAERDRQRDALATAQARIKELEAW